MKSFGSLFRRAIGGIYDFGVKKIGRSDEIEAQLRRTKKRYLDVQSLKAIAGISTGEARRQLRAAAAAGKLERRYMLATTGVPVSFFCEEELGKTFRLSELGFVGDDEGKEVFVNPNDVTEVFIVPGAA